MRFNIREGRCVYFRVSEVVIFIKGEVLSGIGVYFCGFFFWGVFSLEIVFYFLFICFCIVGKF